MELAAAEARKLAARQLKENVSCPCPAMHVGPKAPRCMSSPFSIANFRSAAQRAARRHPQLASKCECNLTQRVGGCRKCIICTCCAVLCTRSTQTVQEMVPSPAASAPAPAPKPEHELVPMATRQSLFAGHVSLAQRPDQFDWPDVSGISKRLLEAMDAEITEADRDFWRCNHRCSSPVLTGDLDVSDVQQWLNLESEVFHDAGKFDAWFRQISHVTRYAFSVHQIRDIGDANEAKRVAVLQQQNGIVFGLVYGKPLRFTKGDGILQRIGDLWQGVRAKLPDATAPNEYVLYGATVVKQTGCGVNQTIGSATGHEYGWHQDRDNEGKNVSDRSTTVLLQAFSREDRFFEKPTGVAVYMGADVDNVCARNVSIFHYDRPGCFVSFDGRRMHRTCCHPTRQVSVYKISFFEFVQETKMQETKNRLGILALAASAGTRKRKANGT